MKKIIFISMLLLCTIGVAAQSLSGRVYYHPNIMADEINSALKEATKDVDKLRANALAKAEKEKGRKLTAEEKVELNNKVDESIKMAQAMTNGMKTSVTVTFKDEKNMVMKAKMQVNDNVLKEAGMSWAKRKMIKMMTAISPSEKGTYVVVNDMVIMSDGKDLDTLRLSDDGKFLTGKLDEKKQFKLRRIQ